MTLPDSAGAAFGTFTYVNVENEELSISNPMSGECFLLVSGAQHVENGTSTTAILYADRGCEEPLSPGLPPRQARDFTISGAPHSVTFG